jgi:nitroreductase
MEEILKLIQERQSARALFDSACPVTKEELRQILEAARWAPTAHNMQNFEIIVVDDKRLLEGIGNIKYPISMTFIRENYKQLSFSKEELLRRKTGFLSTMFPPALRTPETRPDEAPGEKLNLFLGKLIRTTPTLLIVVYDPRKRAPASEGDFLGIMSLGCVMENMWLTAYSLGIGFHVISALRGDQVEKEVKTILDIPKHLKIAFACRLGRPSSPAAEYLRVRRDVEDFTHHNRFGRKIDRTP